MKRPLVILILLVLLSGCDVPGWIVVRNKSKGKAFYHSERVVNDSLYVTSIELEPHPPNNETRTIFGFGHFWTDETIRKYVASVNQIELISSTDTLRLSDKDEMFKFLKQRRGGIFKQTITIKIR